MSYPTSSWRSHQGEPYAYPPAQPSSYARYPPSSSVHPAAPQNPHSQPMSQHSQPPQQHYHWQSASPPRSFGGFGSRRDEWRDMRGPASLPPLDASGSFPYSHQGPYPPSPVSPSYPGGVASQRSSSTSSYTSASQNGGGYYHMAPRPPPEPYMYSDYPPNVPMYAPPAPPRTPPPSAERKERVSSAQTSFTHYQHAAPSSNSRPPSGYAAPPTAPSPTTRVGDGTHHQQQAPSEDLDKFLQEMKEILGPEGLEAISASPSCRQQQQQFDPHPPPASSRPAPSSSSASSRPASSRSEAKYNVSGVLLTEEEYRALADSPSLARRKSSLRALASTHDMFAYGINPSSTYSGPQSAYLDLPADFQRPASAPPTPAFESDTIFQYTPYGPSSNPPSRESAPLNRRRGSSLDPSIPRSFGSSGLVGFAPPQEYSYAPSRPRTPLQYHHRRPSASMQGWSYPETPISVPQQEYYTQPRPPSAYSAYPRQQLDPVSPSPAPSSSHSAPTPTTSSKPWSGRRGRGGNKSISFINFSAADSKTLLNGVAPSGSSKKRQREEDDGRREAKRTEVDARE